MAERRMISNEVVDGDDFTEMPTSAQSLYFHLILKADDDGFVNNSRSIQRSVGCTTDDLKLLIAKAFLLTFESGVVCIRHWHVHNNIRKDRYRPTVYQEELSFLLINSVGVYEYNEVLQDDNQLTTNCQPDDNQMTAQVRLDKNRLDKYKGSRGSSNNRPVNQPVQPTAPTLEQVVEYVAERGNKIDAEKFYDVYAMNGWITARGLPVTDWKAAVRIWERTEYGDKQRPADVQKDSQLVQGSSFDATDFFASALMRTYADTEGAKEDD